jgi:hypothetical protein
MPAHSRDILDEVKLDIDTASLMSGFESCSLSITQNYHELET